MKTKKILIVGGGASGLCAAIMARRKGYEVTIVDKNDTMGKKLLLTGSGRCNFFNKDMDLRYFHSTDPALISSFVDLETIKEVLPFFKSIGILPEDRDGYLYPSTLQASTLREALIYEAENLGCTFLPSFDVQKIEKKKDLFYIYSPDVVLTSDYVVIAAGSKSYPKTGSDGDSYKLASSFGHTIREVYPSLVPLKGVGSYFKRWDGVRMKASLTARTDTSILSTSNGEVQFTDYGLSGICVFNLSGEINRSLHQGKKVFIDINFLYTYGITTMEEALSFFNERAHILSKRNLRIFLEGLFPYKLVPLFIEKASLSKEQVYADLSLDEKKRLVNLLLSFTVPIQESLAFNRSQTSVGGISLLEVDSSSMESKLEKGLYILGEALDIDGDCGGYNLGFAWISALKMGKSLEEVK